MTTAVLGDAGVPNDDTSYTGDVSTAPMSPDWFRAKFSEFQQVLNALDQSYQAGLWVHSQIAASDEIDALLRDYESRSIELKATAAALNAGAAIANAAGLRMPVLSVPQTLGLPALAVPAVIAIAAGSVAGWIAYSRGYIAAMTEAIAAAEEIVTDPRQRAALVARLKQARDAAQLVKWSPLGFLDGPLKLLSIAAIAWIAWKVGKGFADRGAGD